MFFFANYERYALFSGKKYTDGTNFTRLHGCDFKRWTWIKWCQRKGVLILEKWACTLLKAYFRGEAFRTLAKKTFFNPSLSLRLFEQLRCKGNKNHPQRYYLQVFWVMDTSSHFCLSFEERVRVFGFFLFFCIFVTFCLRWQARQNVPKSVAPTLSATDGVIFIQRTGAT